MSLRFQADNDLRRQIVVAIRRHYPDIDMKSAQEASLHGVDDYAVLELCAEEGRILVTHDVTTIGKSLKRFVDGGGNSPGVLVVIPQAAPIAEVVATVYLLWAASSHEEWANRVVKIPF